jgi:hypothetical protein
LVQKLLCLKPTARLGVTRGGATAIKQHPWFADLDWKKLERRGMWGISPVFRIHGFFARLSYFPTSA